MNGQVRVATIVTRFQAGAGAVALRGALALDPSRFQVTIIAGSGDRLLEQAAAAGLAVELEPSLKSPISPSEDMHALAGITRRLAAGPFDVVHTHSAKAGTIGRIAARRASVGRIVHTFHGFPFHEFQSAPRRAAYIAVERRLGRVTDVALCVGSAVAVEAIRRRLVAPEKVRTIGVVVGNDGPRRTALSRDSARRRLGLPLGAPVVGAVGRLAYQKAPEHFVEALAMLPRDDLIGVWVGGGELAENVRRRARQVAPHRRIVLTGERADVLDLLPAFDVFALPSRYEGLPVAIVEAMACGVPVVATAVNAVSDVVIPGITGLLVPPAAPREFANAVAYLLDHPAEAAAMASAATSHLVDRHTDRELGRALTSAYLPGASDEPSRTVAKEYACTLT
jgi:glycosyltransferase involved in cell wall biosynthesis